MKIKLFSRKIAIVLSFTLLLSLFGCLSVSLETPNYKFEIEEDEEHSKYSLFSVSPSSYDPNNRTYILSASNYYSSNDISFFCISEDETIFRSFVETVAEIFFKDSNDQQQLYDLYETVRDNRQDEETMINGHEVCISYSDREHFTGNTVYDVYINLDNFKDEPFERIQKIAPIFERIQKSKDKYFPPFETESNDSNATND